MRGSAVGPAAILVATAVMLAWGWNRWTDAQVDFGRELYVAWRLSEGQVLYRDVAQLDGPFSHYLNALWLRLFGATLRTVELANGLVLALVLWLLHRLLAGIADASAAALACVVFVTTFALGQLTGIGDYNFLCPYSHAYTHGTLLSLAAITSLGRYVATRRLGWVFLAGLATGTTFLTKGEIFAALALALGAGTAIVAWEDRRALGVARVPAALCAGAAVPSLAALTLLATALPWSDAVGAIFGSWRTLFTSRVAELRFYRAGMGTDRLGESLASMATWAGGYTVLLLAAAGLSFLVPPRHRLRAAEAAFAAVGIGLGLAPLEWQSFARPFPLLLACLLAVFLRRAVRAVGRGEHLGAADLTRIVTTVWALGLLAKMLFNTRIYHYGFALAFPAAMVLILAALDWIPAAIARRGGSPELFRGAALAGIWVVVALHLWVTASWFAGKVHPLGTGANFSWADERAIPFARALAALESRSSPRSTLAVLPDGEMLNFLSRRPNSQRFSMLNPTEIVAFGESAIVESYRAHPPDWIALVHKDTSEFGWRFFGRDYGRDVARWIAENYRDVETFGATPFSGEEFGVTLLVRKDAKDSAARGAALTPGLLAPRGS